MVHADVRDDGGDGEGRGTLLRRRDHGVRIGPPYLREYVIHGAELAAIFRLPRAAFDVVTSHDAPLSPAVLAEGAGMLLVPGASSTFVWDAVPDTGRCSALLARLRVRECHSAAGATSG
jgi:hypothetical protein